MPKFVVPFLLAVGGFSIGSLVSGADYSEWPLLGGLPLGNVLAAAGLLSLAGAAFLLSPKDSIRRKFSWTVLLAAALWLPLSIALAGNLSLNFQGVRGTAWLAATSAVAVGVLASFAWAMVGFLLGFRARSSAA